jgi:hypothetical protein
MAKKVTAILVLSVFVLLLVVGMAWARKFAPLPPNLNYAPENNYVTNYLLKPDRVNIFTGTTASPGTQLGTTYYDYQHNGSIPHMIARDNQAAPGGKHFTWMESADADVKNSNRYCVYNYCSPAGVYKGSTRITAGPARAGYSGVALMKDSREVLIFHYAAISGSDPRPRRSLLAIEDTAAGYGEFRYYDIPDSGVTTGMVFGEGGMWPHADIDTLNRIHVVMQSGETAAGRSSWGYTRCREIGTGVNIKLVCESYGVPPDTITRGVFTPNSKNMVASVARTGVISEIAVCSPVSQKVALIWAWPTTDTTLYQVNNDILYVESTNGGDDWIASGWGGGNPPANAINITQFKAEDTYKAYADIAAVYDYNDKLHIFWNMHKLNSKTQESDYYDVALAHWSKDTERICGTDTIRYSVVTAGKWAVTDGSPGGWNRNLCKMNAAVGVPGGSNYNNLYLSWTQFNKGDKGADGYINGEIYTAMSTNSGMTWGASRDVTNSHAPGCLAGNCDSDHWGSIAVKADSFLYHQYINDKDPGGFVQDEGSGTVNPILYYAQPVSDLVAPATPRVDWTPKSLAEPWISVANNGSTTAEFTINNIGTAQLNVTSISETVPWMSLGTGSATITEGGCPVKVDVNINCGVYSDTFLYDSIYVVSNDGAGNSSIYVPVGVVVSNTYQKAQFVNVTNGNFWMTQSNISNIGHQRWGFCLDTLGTTGSTGTLVNPLFDGSIILGQSASAPRVGRYMFDQHNMLALADFKVVNLTANPTNLNAIMVKKRFAPMNPVPPEWGNWWCWGAEEYDVIFKPGTSANSLERWVMVQYLKLFKYDPPDWWSASWPCPGSVCG